MIKSEFAKKRDDLEINLVPFLRNMWQWRKFLLLSFVLVVLISLLIAILIPKTYRSEGFYNLYNSNYSQSRIDGESIKRSGENKLLLFQSNLLLHGYKRAMARLTDLDLFQELVTLSGKLNAEVKKDVKERIILPGQIAKAITPVYAISKDDLLVFGRIQAEEKNAVLGVKISWEWNSPEYAQDVVSLFGDMIKSQYLFSLMYDFVNDNYFNYYYQMQQLSSRLLRNEVSLKLLEKKLENMKLIVKSYPENVISATRQVVSTQEYGYRFLSPANQAVGIESQIADHQESIGIDKHEYEIAALGEAFFAGLLLDLNQEICGASLLRNYSNHLQEYLNKTNLASSSAKEFFHEVSVAEKYFIMLHDNVFRFISGPSSSKKYVRPSRPAIFIFLSLLGFFMVGILVLVVEWWKNKKSLIVNG